MRKTIATVGILIVFLVSLFGTAAAEGELPPDTVPEGGASEMETGEPVVFTHPVVKMLSAYFDREVEVVEDEGESVLDEDPDLDDPEGELPEVEESLVGEQIAALHEEGMGFGVLVKLFAIVEASKMACEDAEAECTLVTVDELLLKLEDGGGMGLLFKDYGKPALLGVGHARQQLKKLERERVREENADGDVVEGDEELLDDEDGPGKGKDKDKDKVNKPVKPVKDKSKAPKNKP